MKNYRAVFHSELSKLQELLSEMAEQVESALHNAVASLLAQDEDLANHVIQGDLNVNKLEQSVLDLGAHIIATQQPVAKDMRKILTAFQIANDLERMGDLALDVAKVTVRIGKESFIKPLADLPKLGEIAQTMLSEGIQSYIQENVDLAYKTAKLDDEADHLYGQILRDLFNIMIGDPQTINQAMLLCFVGRYLERAADHATNIAESTVYLVSGQRPDLN